MKNRLFLTPMMALLCSTMGYAVQHDEKSLNIFDLCGPCTDSDKLEKTDSSYKKIDANQLLIKIINNEDTEDPKFVKIARDVVCNRKLSHWKSNIYYSVMSSMLQKSIKKGNPGRYITTLLANNIRECFLDLLPNNLQQQPEELTKEMELSYSYHGYLAFKALIKNQDVENKDKLDDATAVSIAKILLDNGIIPQYVDNSFSSIYVDNSFSSISAVKVPHFKKPCNDSTHAVCSYLKMKQTQTKIDELEKKQLEICKAYKAYQDKIDKDKEKKDKFYKACQDKLEKEKSESDATIQNLLNKDQK